MTRIIRIYTDLKIQKANSLSVLGFMKLCDLYTSPWKGSLPFLGNVTYFAKHQRAGG